MEDRLNMQKNIKKNIKGNNYKKLLNWVSESSTVFSFVIRKDVGISENSIMLIERLTDFIIDSYPTNEWLSNEIVDSPIMGHIYFYELNKTTKNILLEVSNSLFDWGDDNLTDLPEDIAFYDEKRHPVLYVNGHENYAIVNVSSVKEYFKLTFL
ncbi:hypothetical protein BAU18_003010 [Enterococcus diestrammenae]|uniref:Uncharacterized protein n=2 Tax=Enterococcus TaxID=1350 RepID=A0ABV0F5S1_9ENTE